tara:strand:- start:66 stop:239 length:174 start_codon:yes stop_codon:yes gene_type:complete
MTFDQWLSELDSILLPALGIDALSLADQPYSLWDRHANGDTPRETADDIIADPMAWL